MDKKTQKDSFVLFVSLVVAFLSVLREAFAFSVIKVFSLYPVLATRYSVL
jgi:hypothetical protein